MKMILDFHNHGCVEPASAHTHENSIAAEPQVSDVDDGGRVKPEARCK
jgi:hypothetical protein